MKKLWGTIVAAVAPAAPYAAIGNEGSFRGGETVCYVA